MQNSGGQYVHEPSKESPTTPLFETFTSIIVSIINKYIDIEIYEFLNFDMQFSKNMHNKLSVYQVSFILLVVITSGFLAKGSNAASSNTTIISSYGYLSYLNPLYWIPWSRATHANVSSANKNVTTTINDSQDKFKFESQAFQKIDVGNGGKTPSSVSRSDIPTAKPNGILHKILLRGKVYPIFQNKPKNAKDILSKQEDQVTGLVSVHDQIELRGDNSTGATSIGLESLPSDYKTTTNSYNTTSPQSTNLNNNNDKSKRYGWFSRLIFG